MTRKNDKFLAPNLGLKKDIVRTPKYRLFKRLAKKLSYLIMSNANNRDLMTHMDYMDEMLTKYKYVS